MFHYAGFRAVSLSLFFILGFAACDGRRTLKETPLPASQTNVALEAFRPPEALDRIGDWYPHDWRLHLLLGLTDTSWEGKVGSLKKADSLHPGEPMVAYQLCMAYLERDSRQARTGAALARPWLDKALAADPENGVLRVVEAYVLLKQDSLPKARALFLDPRRLPGGDFYYPRLEEAVLGLFSDSRHLNPYTLTEAVELYRSVPFPPFEKLIDILYSVFLSPLAEHPYDIRVRGRDAAQGPVPIGPQAARPVLCRPPGAFRGIRAAVPGLYVPVEVGGVPHPVLPRLRRYRQIGGGLRGHGGRAKGIRSVHGVPALAGFRGDGLPGRLGRTDQG